MEEIIAEVSQGQLKGYRTSNLDGEEFFSFMGVPYAKAPIGDLRFKAPVPCEPWHGVRDATKVGDSCYQRGLLEHVVEGSEDCLNLNVYTKTLPVHGEESYPVMVWFHGGGFTLGSNKPDVYGPDYLMTKDIVLVAVNYRVGVLGFLCLDDEQLEVPGNAGLKDQREALRWVQTNIKNFNGDPNNVTIFGVSSGSASVHLHVLSPSSKDLFHKAIMQSGVALNPFVFSNTKVTELMEIMDINVNSEKEALEILMGLSVEELFAAQEKLMAKRGTMMNLFSPVIEKPNKTEVITKPPIEILLSGEYNKVPIMMGYTADEGLVMEFEKSIKKMRRELLEEKPPNLEDLIPPEMGVPRGSELARTIVSMFQETYFTGKNAQVPYLIMSDAIILAGTYLSMKHHRKTSPHPIFLYKMTLDAGLNFLKLLAKLDHIPGACHGDDVGYLFRNSFRYLEVKGSIEDIAVRRFVKLWTNFAKYGNPTPDEEELGVTWKPVSDDGCYCLDIGSELSLITNPEGSRLDVWEKIYHLSPNTKDY